MADIKTFQAPPAYSIRDDNSGLDFEEKWNANAWIRSLSDTDRKQAKSSTLSLARIIDRDRLNYDKLQAGVAPLDDRELFSWMESRGFNDGPDRTTGEKISQAWDWTAQGAAELWKTVKGAGRALAEFAPDMPEGLEARTVEDLEDNVMKRERQKAVAGAALASGQQEMMAITFGVANLWKKAQIETEQMSNDRKFDFLNTQKVINDIYTEQIGALAEGTDLTEENLGEMGEGLWEVVNPSNFIPAGVSFKAGQKLLFGGGKKGLLVGRHYGATKDLMELNARRQVRISSGVPTKKIDDLIIKQRAVVDALGTQVAQVTAGTSATRRGVGGSIAAVGSGIEKVGAAGARFKERVVSRINKIDSPGVQTTLKNTPFVAGAAVAGGATGGPIGAAIVGTAAAVIKNPTILQHAGRNMKIVGRTFAIGETTQPLMRNIRQNAQVNGLTRFGAGMLDTFTPVARPLMKGGAAAVRGGGAAAAVGAAYGYVLGGGESAEAVFSQIGSIAPIGVVGGIAGSYSPLGKKNDDAKIRESQRRLVEETYVEGSTNRKAWDQLTHSDQTSLATVLHAYPDVDLVVRESVDDKSKAPDKDGKYPQIKVAGSHGIVNGRSTIFVNPADPVPLKAVLAHELIHDMTRRGLAPGFEREYLGSVEENRIGTYTKIDDNGAPVVSENFTRDGKRKLFEQNDEFKALKREYEERLIQASEEAIDPLTDEEFAMELAAEEGADWLLSNDGENFNKAIRPSISGMFSERMMRSIGSRLGLTLETDGTISKGTGLFSNLNKNQAVRSTVAEFTRQRSKSGKTPELTHFDSGISHTAKEIRDNPEILKNYLSNERLRIDPKTGWPEGTAFIDGKLVILNEKQMYMRPKEIKAHQKELADQIRTLADEVSHKYDDRYFRSRSQADGRTVYGGILPPEVIQAIRDQGRFNPHQLNMLEQANNMLIAGDGQPSNFFYQPAEGRPIGNRKRKKGSYAGHWRSEIPYSIKIDGNNNIHIMMFSMDTVAENLDRAWLADTAGITDVWESRERMLADIEPYLKDIAAGRDGDTTVSTMQKNFINGALGLKGKDRKDANVYSTPLNRVSQAAIVDRRVDRTNKFSPTSGTSIPLPRNIYGRAKLNLLPGTLEEGSIQTIEQTDTRPLPVDSTVTIQRDEDLGDGDVMPGYTLINFDDPRAPGDGELGTTTNPQALADLGYSIPFIPSHAESGTYTLNEIEKMNAPGTDGFSEQFRQLHRPATVVHYSNQSDLKFTDPAQGGTGLPGAERNRAKDYPELYVDRTYFGLEGYQKEPGLGPNQFVGEIESDAIYDMNEDPLDLYSEANDWVRDGEEYGMFDDSAKISRFEQLIAENGFDGYFMEDVVAMFEPVEVNKVQTDLSHLPASKAPVDPAKGASYATMIKKNLTDEAFAKEIAKTRWATMEGVPDGALTNSPEGIAGTNGLRTYLKKNKIKNIEVEGRWVDSEQGPQTSTSFMIFGVDTDKLATLARDFDQESIAFNEGLIHQDGSIRPVKGKTKFGEAAKNEDFHTVMPDGKAFSLDLDFSEGSIQPQVARQELSNEAVVISQSIDETRIQPVDGGEEVVYKTEGFDLTQQNMMDTAMKNVAASYADPSAQVLEITTDKSGQVMFNKDNKGTLKAVNIKAQPYALLSSPWADEVSAGAKANSQERKDAVAQAMGAELVKRYGEWMKNADIAAGQGWYSRMRIKLKEAFGDDTELATQLLGATSAKTAVVLNFKYAMEAFDLTKSGAYDRNIKGYLEGLEMLREGTLQKPGESNPKAIARHIKANDLAPRKSNGTLYGSNSVAVLRVISGVWLDTVQGPKTPNFAGNLSGRTLEATIDVWASRTLRDIAYNNDGTASRYRILPSAEGAPSNPDFFLGQQAFKVAAEELGMNPDDLQAIAWFGEKHNWDVNGWTDKEGASKSSFDEVFAAFFDPEGARRTAGETAALLPKTVKEQKAIDKAAAEAAKPQQQELEISA